MKTKFTTTLLRATATMLLAFLTSNMTLWAQTSEKFSMSTQIFLNEQTRQAEQPANVPSRKRALPEGRQRIKPQPLLAKPDTIGGVAYISCFIHMTDPNRLSELEALGVQVQSTFRGLSFITAYVPVTQLQALAELDNVTKIKVAERKRPTTDVARQLTNVDDLLTLSPAATAQGITSKYDGTGVILGVIDMGIDFQHIAFKDKNGNSRIKRAYVYDGESEHIYNSVTSYAPTTDYDLEDHGTHTSSTAGGSSVIVNGTNVTITDDHANATYGGMAPNVDLYLAGVNGLLDTYLVNALEDIVNYANAQGKPLIVSNSWGANMGPRDGTGEWADLVTQYFGESSPNHIIVFAAGNDAGHAGNEDGGLYVQKSNASNSNPLGTIIKTEGYDGDAYYDLMADAWSNKKMNCIIYVLDNSTGAILNSWTVTQSKHYFPGLSTYYSGSLEVDLSTQDGKYNLSVYSDSQNYLESEDYNAYSIAIELYPANGSADIRMWGGGSTYFTNSLSTTNHTWTKGTDDMSVCDEATIPNAIAVGAYKSKNNTQLGDIAYFSSYAIPSFSPTGQVIPWITAPGSLVTAGVNHFHTEDPYSYYSELINDLVVNNPNSPYGLMQGTSMATPVVSGIIALWLQAANEIGAELTVHDIKTIMQETAIQDSYTMGTNASHFGNGKIDALAGIRYIRENYGGMVQPVLSSGYTLVTDAASLAEGDNILITHVDGNDCLALGITQNTNNRAATTDVILNADGTLTPGNDAQIISLEKDGNNFLFNVGNGYLYAASSTKNYLRTETIADDNAKATISISQGDAIITFQGSNTRNILRYNANNGSPIFSCYASNSSVQSAQQIYREVTAVTLNDDGTGNAEQLATYAGQKVSVQIAGRRFYKDGSWNTLCLPFDVENFTGTSLQGATVKTLSSSDFDETTGTLTLNFSEVTSTEAGKPYLVKWTTGADILGPIFPNVTIDATANNVETANVDFIGTSAPVVLDANDKTKLFLSDDNLLYWPDEDVTINSCRAYFALKGMLAGEPAASAPELRIVLNLDGENTATDMNSSFTDSSVTNCVKFFQNGRLFIRRNGTTYDALGRTVE